MIFDYPEAREKRRHGPAGYAEYESYRPWLRDEFEFRCVYCLKRETWGQLTSEFELDHFDPQSLNPRQKLDYANLVYACRRCNSIKGAQAVSDPFRFLHPPLVTMLADGSLKSSEVETIRLVQQLALNSAKLTLWRRTWLRIVALAKERDPELYFQLVGFPTDLPNLKKLRPPRNDRSDGPANCWHARRESGTLPMEY